LTANTVTVIRAVLSVHCRPTQSLSMVQQIHTRWALDRLCTPSYTRNTNF